ncbi:metallophosphoesterase [Cupriavidus consociatus]|uniref:metallophosphoesterase n=1 Tax=Cupriavidus consociatus TaxID=2821357 RepID=UPI001AE90038|nr:MULTISPECIES: metallophosphoesterase [unclassified Cupriavidus]MBP0620367.1 metallophosphoesterase [Cupriavidus sp. LEh25]MDK2657024.1 metallophosphoesterase [Cupriavidus sp. LEh21]
MNARRRHAGRILAAALLLCAASTAWPAPAGRGGKAAPKPKVNRVALIADLPQWPAAEANATALLDSFAERRLDLVIHAGGIKGDTESCSDGILTSRQQLLAQSPLPLLYVPGETDWAECRLPVNGKFDSVERLNRLRELFFPEDATLGQHPRPVVRQSDQALFRTFRENARLTLGDILIVGLNVPGDNNHYRNEGGRNSEFEDRREANRQWLARAFSLARQRDMNGIVVVAHADPHFANGWEKKGRPTLLDGFMRHRTRDGYLEFKRQLRDLSARFSGQVLLVHAGESGFGIDKPLRDNAGKVLQNFTRVSLPNNSVAQWAELVITPNAAAPFSVSLKDAPTTP